jgi:hypothetical protein
MVLKRLIFTSFLPITAHQRFLAKLGEKGACFPAGNLYARVGKCD